MSDGPDDQEWDAAGPDEAELRRRVEEKYDFEDFGPADMREMTVEEWEVAFDPESWITGGRLLDRVERDLRSRVASREVFAVVERVAVDGRERVLAYSDNGYAVVAPDGTVTGEGTVRRDVEPTVALCSMEAYDLPAEPVESDPLPSPEEVPEGTGELGNTMLQVVALAQIVVGIGLLGAWIVTDLSTVVAPVAALGFLVAGLFLFLVVANARLSDHFRAEQFRNRLRALGREDGERPDFVPSDEELVAGDSDDDGDGVDSDDDGDTRDAGDPGNEDSPGGADDAGDAGDDDATDTEASPASGAQRTGSDASSESQDTGTEGG